VREKKKKKMGSVIGSARASQGHKRNIWGGEVGRVRRAGCEKLQRERFLSLILGSTTLTKNQSEKKVDRRMSPLLRVSKGKRGSGQGHYKIRRAFAKGKEKTKRHYRLCRALCTIAAGGLDRLPVGETVAGPEKKGDYFRGKKHRNRGDHLEGISRTN